ncbi:hypothetical protein MPSEU_000245300 [Mayamaea pseudoterrestris]|nr:hypothetical protein MPSEU_000245300 [Mayamaea pseudoterrestris]
MSPQTWLLASILAVSLLKIDGASRSRFHARPRILQPIRGGSSDPRLMAQKISPQYTPEVGEVDPRNQQYEQPQEYGYVDDVGLPNTFGDVNDDPMHETVQDRLDHWKQRQQEYAATAQASARDEQGRVKLMMSVSKGSRAVMFIILLFRALFLYEVADKYSGMRRLMLVIPVCLLLVGNLAGVVASFTSPSHSSKKRLKAILNCDKFVEALLIVFCFLRLTILPSKYTAREVYVASVFHSVFFIIQAQAFTKLSWDDNGPTPAAVTMNSDGLSDNALRQPGLQPELRGPQLPSGRNQDFPSIQRRN